MQKANRVKPSQLSNCPLLVNDNKDDDDDKDDDKDDDDDDEDGLSSHDHY